MSNCWADQQFLFPVSAWQSEPQCEATVWFQRFLETLSGPTSAFRSGMLMLQIVCLKHDGSSLMLDKVQG